MRNKLGTRIGSTRRILAAVALIGGLQAPAALAQSGGCDLTSLSAAYGHTLNGFVYDSQYYMYYISAVGRLVFDGKGGLSGADTLSFDGSISKRQLSGTYTVNADCTGSVTVASASGASTHFDFVVLDSGKEIHLVQTDAGFVLSGALKVQGTPPAPPASSGSTAQ